MGTASTAAYRENRARFPLEELRQRDGQWVAFSADGRRIVAGAATIGELADQVRAAGEDLCDVVLERVELTPLDVHPGAADLL